MTCDADLRPPALPPALRVWIVVAAVHVASVSPAQAQQDTVLAEAAVELRLSRGQTEIVPALVYDGTLLLPVNRLFTMAEVKVTAFALRDSLVAVLEPLGRLIHFHPDRGQLVLGDSVIPIEPHDALWWDGDLFAPPDMFERTLGVTMRINWRNLSVDVGRTDGLPLMRRLRRERRRTTVARAPGPPALEVHPALPTAGGAVVNWSFVGSAGSQTDYYILDLGVGAQLAGGNLTLRPELQNYGGRGDADLRIAWERAWPDRLWLSQVRIGDVRTNGRRAQLVRGAVVTNAPFLRSSEFDVEHVSGTLPAGWDVEMYDRGRLLGYSTVDAAGSYQIPLDVRYGQNPFELVMYGPTGEVTRMKRTIRVPFSRLPTGQLEYAAAVGQCRYGTCDALFSGDARYGLSRRVTFQGGLDVLARESGTLWQPYAAVSGAILHPLTLTGEAVLNGLLRGSANFEPSTDLRITLDHTEFAEAGRGVSGSALEERRTEATGLWWPGLRSRSLALQVFFARSEQVTATRTIVRASASARLGGLRHTAGMRYDGTSLPTLDDRRRFAVDYAADAMLGGRNPWIGGTNVRGELSVEPTQGLGAIAVSAGRRIARAIRADVGFQWLRGAGSGISLSVNTVLPGPRVGVRSQTNTTTGTRGLVLSNGSAVYDQRSRNLLWTTGSDLGRAGVTGLVYVDDNGNGSRDAGEAGLPDVRVEVAGRSVATDAAGRFTAWDLPPFEPVDVTVDSLSFDDPRMLPGVPRLQVRSTPNVYVPIEVPVVVGAEITGWVILDGEALAGIPVVLRELTTGAEVTLMTFSDGTFYRAGVRPGEWEITLPDVVAEELGVYALPMHLFIPPGTGSKRYDGIGIELGRLGG